MGFQLAELDEIERRSYGTDGRPKIFLADHWCVASCMADLSAFFLFELSPSGICRGSLAVILAIMSGALNDQDGMVYAVFTGEIIPKSCWLSDKYFTRQTRKMPVIIIAQIPGMCKSDFPVSGP